MNQPTFIECMTDSEVLAAFEADGFADPEFLHDHLYPVLPASPGELPPGYADRTQLYLDDVARDNREITALLARRAQHMEAARAWSELSDEFVIKNPKMSEGERLGWIASVFTSLVAAQGNVSQISAGKLIEESRMLAQELPATLAALESATISYRHAVVVINQAGSLPASARAAFELAVLPLAPRLPAHIFRKKVIQARERLHPESIQTRTVDARSMRRVVFEPDCDGMSWLHAFLPTPQAKGVFDRLTDLAADAQGDGETRTLTQLRADITADLLLEGVVLDDMEIVPMSVRSRAGTKARHTITPGRLAKKSGSAAPLPGRMTLRRKTLRRKAGAVNWGIRPTVIVTVPAMTLLGHSDEPAFLQGYGPIDPDTARELTARAPSFLRVLTDPDTGEYLSMNQHKYKIGKDLRTWLQIRDGTCRSPGCDRPATHTDADHTRAWADGGLSEPDNLSCLCKRCHRMKHATTWTVTQTGNGVLEWRSPTGSLHTTRPDNRDVGTTLPIDGPRVDGLRVAGRPVPCGPEPQGTAPDPDDELPPF